LLAASLPADGLLSPVIVPPEIVGVLIVGLVRVLFVKVFVFVVVITSAIVSPCAVVTFSMCWLASRKSRPVAMWRTAAPAECATPVPEFSTPRVMVSVLELTTVTSTISSRAVSGSMTIVNVSPVDTLAPPSSDVADTTVVVVSVELSAADSVVCCERDEYFLVVIQVPIGGSSEF